MMAEDPLAKGLLGPIRQQAMPHGCQPGSPSPPPLPNFNAVRQLTLGSIDLQELLKSTSAGEVDFRELFGAIQEGQQDDQNGGNNGAGDRSPLVSLTRDGSMLAELFQAYQESRQSSFLLDAQNGETNQGEGNLAPPLYKDMSVVTALLHQLEEDGDPIPQESGVGQVTDDSPDSCNTQLQPAAVADFSFAAQAANLPPFRLEPVQSEPQPPPKRASQVLPPVPWPPSPFEPAASLTNPYDPSKSAAPPTQLALQHSPGDHPQHPLAPDQYRDTHHRAVENAAEPVDASGFPGPLSDGGIFSAEGAEGLCDGAQWPGFAPRVEPGFCVGTTIRAATGNDAEQFAHEGTGGQFAHEGSGGRWLGFGESEEGEEDGLLRRSLGPGVEAMYPGHYLPSSGDYGLDSRGNFPPGGRAQAYGEAFSAATLASARTGPGPHGRLGPPGFSRHETAPGRVLDVVEVQVGGAATTYAPILPSKVLSLPPHTNVDTNSAAGPFPLVGRPAGSHAPLQLRIVTAGVKPGFTAPFPAPTAGPARPTYSARPTYAGRATGRERSAGPRALEAYRPPPPVPAATGLEPRTVVVHHHHHHVAIVHADGTITHREEGRVEHEILPHNPRPLSTGARTGGTPAISVTSAVGDSSDAAGPSASWDPHGGPSEVGSLPKTGAGRDAYLGAGPSSSWDPHGGPSEVGSLPKAGAGRDAYLGAGPSTSWDPHGGASEVGSLPSAGPGREGSARPQGYGGLSEMGAGREGYRARSEIGAGRAGYGSVPNVGGGREAYLSPGSIMHWGHGRDTAGAAHLKKPSARPYSAVGDDFTFETVRSYGNGTYGASDVPPLFVNSTPALPSTAEPACPRVPLGPANPPVPAPVPRLPKRVRSARSQAPPTKPKRVAKGPGEGSTDEDADGLSDEGVAGASTMTPEELKEAKRAIRKEKNRASAAASRAKREAHTAALEEEVRKLEKSKEWLEQKVVAMSAARLSEVPQRAPIRHMSM